MRAEHGCGNTGNHKSLYAQFLANEETAIGDAVESVEISDIRDFDSDEKFYGDRDAASIT